MPTDVNSGAMVSLQPDLIKTRFDNLQRPSKTLNASDSKKQASGGTKRTKENVGQTRGISFPFCAFLSRLKTKALKQINL